MACTNQVRVSAIALLPQYLYEFQKGVRRLFLLTMTPHEAKAVQKRLERECVAVHVQAVSVTKVNLFFGQPAYVQTARRLAVRALNQFTPEEDFMLGTLLGYDGEQQCQRYLQKVADGDARDHASPVNLTLVG
jgi:Protein of unknown function (DUF2023)